MSDQVRMG